MEGTGMTLINTKGMAFFGPGSEWFWAALQFTALAITFIAIYRQLRIARSARAVDQVQGFSRRFGDERMARYRLEILVALRDGMEIPLGVGIALTNEHENAATLGRFGHIDVKLLWDSLSIDFQIWWIVMQPVVTRGRALDGALAYSNWEWLVREFQARDRRAGDYVPIDAEYVANWHAGGIVERIQDRIRVEQALRSIIVASPDVHETEQPTAAGPAQPPRPTPAAESDPERQSD
jgi:hypothetical protein